MIFPIVALLLVIAGSIYIVIRSKSITLGEMFVLYSVILLILLATCWATT